MARECLTPCPSCPRVNAPVPGDGPVPCRIMFIGEAPGKDEDRYGRPFVGRTGKEFNEAYLPMAGLTRNDIYITNTVKCHPRNDRDVSETIIDDCSRYHLRSEIARVQPEVIVLMGATANSLVGVDVEMHHGIPLEAEILGFRKPIFPTIHPAAGLHDSSYMIQLKDDFRTLGEWLNGTAQFPVDEYPDPTYERLTEASHVLDVIGPSDLPLAIDTEFIPADIRRGQVEDEPYCLTFSTKPGTGYLIKAKDAGAVGAFAGVIGGHQSPRFQGGLPSFQEQYRRGWRMATCAGRGGWRGPVLLHNVMADHPVLYYMGVWLPMRKVKDTMVMSYHLGWTPQGLKALAFRLCGMVMNEFMDVVTPHAIEYCKAYVETLLTMDWPKPEPFMVDAMVEEVEEVDGVPVVTGKKLGQKLYKPQGLNTKLKRMVTDLNKATTDPKRLEILTKRWKDWSDVEKEPAIGIFGDMPRPSVTMVPDKELLPYACRDADATLRVYEPLIELRRQVRKVRI